MLQSTTSSTPPTGASQGHRVRFPHSWQKRPRNNLGVRVSFLKTCWKADGWNIVSLVNSFQLKVLHQDICTAQLIIASLRWQTAGTLSTKEWKGDEILTCLRNAVWIPYALSDHIIALGVKTWTRWIPQAQLLLVGWEASQTTPVPSCPVG